jgi:uncharacterized membrane protein YczE
MAISPYQSFKLSLTGTFGLSRDGFHIVLGFLVFLLFSALFKIKLSSLRALVAPLVFALILEAVDVRDTLSLGRTVDYVDGAHDIFFSMILPFAAVVYLRYLDARVPVD